MNKFISYATAFLVFLLGIGSFILSYNALYGVALDNGLSQNLSYIWPLLVDFALIVFSLAVVQSNLNNEPAAWRWGMVGFYTVATVAFNVYHAPNNLAAQVVAVVAPISLFLSFETLMSMLKKSVKKKAAVLSLAEISAKLGVLEAEYRSKRDNLAAELERLQRDRLAEIETMANQMSQQTEIEATLRRAEVDALITQQATLQAEIDKVTQKLGDISQQVEEKRRELNATQDATLVNVWDLISHIDKTHLDTQTRQFFVALLTNAKVPQKDIAEWAGITVKTVQRDIAGCNGLIKKATDFTSPEDIPGTYGRNGNGKAGK